jgi:hypothetical protein
METTTAATITDVVPLRARVAADVRDKPPRNIEATVATCQQKSCVAPLVTTRRQHAMQPLTARQEDAGATTAAATTDNGPLRPRIAAGGVGHEPSRDGKVAVFACQQKGCVTVLRRQNTTPSAQTSATTPQSPTSDSDC